MVQFNHTYASGHRTMPEDILFLIKKAQQGCVNSRRFIVQNYIKLVIDTMKQYPSINDSYDDLFRAGTIGLIKAIYYYQKPDREGFEKYAISLIQDEILYCLQKHGSVLN